LIAVCHSNLANLCRDAERLAAAEAEVAKALADYDEQVTGWLRGCPLHPAQIANLSVVYGCYRDLLFALGQVKEAEQFLRKGLAVADRLIRDRPLFFEQVGPFAWAFRAQVGRDLGAVLQFTGRPNEAGPRIRQAIEDGKTAVT